MAGGGMFTRTLLFCFCFIGMFAVVFAAIPGEYFVAESYDSTSGLDKDIAERLSLANLTVYDTGGQDNMTIGYSSLEDAPSPPQWLITGTTDDFIEVWWDTAVPISLSIDIRHATRNGFPWTWWGWHIMDTTFMNGSEVTVVGGDTHIRREDLLDAWDSSSNTSAFNSECTHAYVSILFTIHNFTRDTTIGDAWDNGEIDYVLSYEKNWNATNINAMTLLGQLLAFQNPSLGIPGFMGTVLNYAIALPFWTITAIAIIKLIQSILPWIRGVED